MKIATSYAVEIKHPGDKFWETVKEYRAAEAFFADVANKEWDKIMKVVDHTPQFNIGELTDYEAMKPKLMMEVIPQRGNEERLENIPHGKAQGSSLQRLRLSLR